MTEARLTIGRVADAAGANIETIRYYQRRGLIGLPPKRAGGFRYCPPMTASRVRFIKRAQALGMSLQEVQHLLRLDAKGACSQTRSLAVTKLALIEEKLWELTQLRDILQGLIIACDQSHGSSCPIIDSLESEQLLES